MTLEWAWSYSRSKLLDECPRSFELGLRNRQSGGQPPNNFRSLHGTAIHEGIAYFIGRWARNDAPTADDAIRMADLYLQDVWSNRNLRIIESINGRTIDQSRFDAIRRRTRGDLRDFFRMLWPRFETCKYDTHEKRQQLTVNGVRVAIQIDFSCWAANGDYYIVDWKTGGEGNQRAGAVQLAVYSLWAHEIRGIAVDKIRPLVVSTRTGEIIKYRATALDLDYVRLGIEADQHTVADYETRGFPANPEPTRCAGCRHLRLCGPGERAVSEGAVN